MRFMAGEDVGRAPASVAEVVAGGLCIGCGLCEAVSGGRVPMRMTAAGSLRPHGVGRLRAEEEAVVLAVCPGARVAAREEEAAEAAEGGGRDGVWGVYRRMCYAWAGDADVRFRAATGGALTALAAHALECGARFVLQVAARADFPMRSEWRMNGTAAEVEAAAGSRYGPVAPLAGLYAALGRGVPFAVVGKPCDLSAVHNLAALDARVDELCRWRLALVCGGQSRLAKSRAVLAEVGVAEKEVTLFRYRGYGNPGRTRVETADGRAFEKSYDEMWGDAAGWQIETRCKLCADALGECADVACADVWDDAVPEGEDAGFNGIVVRTAAGTALVESAVAAGTLVVGEAISPAQFGDFQPHQVAKKRALAARFAGLAAAGACVPEARGLRVAALSHAVGGAAYEAEKEGTARRVREGRFAEET